MITNRQAYETRHAQIVQRAAKQFLDQKRKMPTFNVRQAIASYSLAIRAAIARRDGTGIAGAHAAAAAHLAINFWHKKSGDARRRKKQLAQRPTPSSLPTFRPHAGA